jgi:hypothetical protein
MYDRMPWYVSAPLMIVLWTIVLLRVWRVQDKIKNYFAKRRESRRMIQYLKQDIQLTMSMYKNPGFDPHRRMVLTHDNRNRR